MVHGAASLASIFTGYGDMAPDFGAGPDQARVQAPDGYAYLAAHFPK